MSEQVAVSDSTGDLDAPVPRDPETDVPGPGGLAGRGLVLVTGASSGWGRTCAVQLARMVQSGSRLVLLARDEAELRQTERQIKEVAISSITTNTVPQDLSSTAQLSDAWLSGALGPALGFDYCLLINNAGTLGAHQLLSNLKPADVACLQHYYTLNLISPLVLTAGFLRHTQLVSRRCIVNVTSLCAVKPFASLGLYCAGKAARDMSMRVLALERPELRILSYAPGPMRTRMTLEGMTQAQHADTKGMFVEINEGSDFIEPSKSADKLIELLQRDRFSNGDHIDVFD